MYSPFAQKNNRTTILRSLFGLLSAISAKNEELNKSDNPAPGPTPTPDPTPMPDTDDDNKKSDETISGDKEQAEDSVKTADMYNVAGYSIMLFMALAGIVFVIHEDKKKKNTID